jgi:hypothetical protein
LPVKWRSSLAVFYYEPKPDPENPNPNEITTFLKVISTVTGYQPDPEVDENLLRRYGQIGIKILQNIDQLTDNYYPAYSALVQLAVFPQDSENWSIDKYPILTDFKPQKRELIEQSTVTGEFLVGSDSNVNVRKGQTSSDSTEISNMDRGGSSGANISYAGAGAGAI